MRKETRIGQGLAELVRRLTPEEKREFVRWLDWEELEVLRIQEKVAEPERRIGDPTLYVGTTPDGLAFELPVECVPAFVKCIPTILSVASIEVYIRRNGRSEEYQVDPHDFGGFLDTHRQILLGGSMMMELGEATLVSGGGGCMLLSLEGISSELQRRLATEALRVCGFDYKFTGDDFTAVVRNDQLEVTDQ